MNSPKFIPNVLFVIGVEHCDGSTRYLHTLSIYSAKHLEEHPCLCPFIYDETDNIADAKQYDNPEDAKVIIYALNHHIGTDKFHLYQFSESLNYVEI